MAADFPVTLVLKILVDETVFATLFVAKAGRHTHLFVNFA